MTSRARVLDDPSEIEVNDAEASRFMQEGISRVQSGGDLEPALACFDRALELRSRLPTELSIHAYGLAACWLNRGEALAGCGRAHHAQALRAYDEALALLRLLPLCEDARFPRRLAIAHQNRALILAAQDPPASADAIVALLEATRILNCADATDACDHDYLRGVVWMNLANVQASQATMASDLEAQDSARQALALLRAHEREVEVVAEAGLKARHVLCRIAARRLSAAAQPKTIMPDVHEATDLAEEALGLVGAWEQRRVAHFRTLAADLFRFGALVYAHYQPHFLEEFLSEQLDPQLFSQSYIESPEMQDAAREIVLLLAAVENEGPKSISTTRPL